MVKKNAITIFQRKLHDISITIYRQTICRELEVTQTTKVLNVEALLSENRDYIT